MNTVIWYLVIAWGTGGQTAIPAGSQAQCEARARQYANTTATVFCAPAVVPGRGYTDRPGYPR